jgi:integrase
MRHYFAKWAAEEGLDLAQIDEMAQRRFLDTHLPFYTTCRAFARKGRKERSVPLWRPTAAIIRSWRRQIGDPAG